MSLYKRKDSPHWWVKLSHDGRTIQRSAGTADRRKAQEYHDKLKAELWDVSRLGVKPSYVWENAVVRWLDERGHKASIRDDRNCFRWLHPHLAGVKLSAIDRTLIDRLSQARKQSGVSNATVNRMLQVLRAVLRTSAHEWEWIERAPKVRLLPEPKGRVRYLLPEEATRLLQELPPHLSVMAAFSLLTGWRQRNVRDLKWSQVDLERGHAWVHADQAKAGKGIGSPLTSNAVQLLRGQVGRHPEYVFTYRGEPVRWVNNTAWKSALARAGIENFRWHDLRHTWATWHMQAGTPLPVVQQLGGWSTSQMTQRYAHLTPAYLSDHVAAFGRQVRLSPLSGYDLATSSDDEGGKEAVTH